MDAEVFDKEETCGVRNKFLRHRRNISVEKNYDKIVFAPSGQKSISFIYCKGTYASLVRFIRYKPDGCNFLLPLTGQTFSFYYISTDIMALWAIRNNYGEFLMNKEQNVQERDATKVEK